MTQESDRTPPPWRARLQHALHAGRGERSSRYFQLATVGRDGRPANRTLVFRGFGDDGGVRFVTDARTAKAAEIEAGSAGEICWWIEATKEQFRLAGRLEMVADAAERRHAWDGLSPGLRVTFLGPEPKASRAPDDAFPAEAGDATTPEVFRLVVLRPETVDYLNLATTPQTRVVHRLTGSGWKEEAVNP